jgi:GTP-binding protein HflX
LTGTLDLIKAKGLKKSEINQLNRLLQRRLPPDRVITIDLAEAVAEISHRLGHPISLVANRRGQIVNVTLGQPWQINTPELRQVRVGPGRLCGHRVIYTRLAEKGKHKNDESKSGDSHINKDNLMALAKNRLDLLAQVNVDSRGTFSRAHGEQSRLADSVEIIHLLPDRDNQGNLWKQMPTCTIRLAQEEDFSIIIQSLEEEFRKQSPGLPVRAGEERAILVGVITEDVDPWQMEDDLDELAQLAKTAGATVSKRFTQSRREPDPRFFLGAGKTQELALLVQETGANLVIFDHELNALQHTSLQKALAVKVLDRTELILDIFAQRAQTAEGKLQVELAQLKYLYPRLIGKGTAMSRLGGGIGTRGPGETKLEIDRRRIRQRITHLENDIVRIRNYRDTQRRMRNENHIPVIAITGYTNSGKSTLLNAITKSKVFVEDKLFATLDPITRKTTLPDMSTVLLCDTVGFIKKLPTPLVAAFRATLEEVLVADILLHVVDASHPHAIDQVNSVYDVLSELGAIDKPIITVLNKSELVRKEDLIWLVSQVPNPVIISALKRLGFSALLNKIQDTVQEVFPHQAKVSLIEAS